MDVHKHRGKIALAGAAVVAAAAAGLAVVNNGCSCTAPQFASTSLGNVFVVLSGGSDPCTRQSVQSTLASATSGAKCSSPQAAWTAMNGGDTAVIQDGTYTGQQFTVGGTTKSSVVTFKADNWVAPTDAQGVLSDNIQVVYPNGVQITTDKIHVLGVSATATTNIGNSINVNNTAGGLTICYNGSVSCNPNSGAQNTDILVQGFHGKNLYVRGSGATIDLSEFGGFDPCQFWVPSGGASNGSYVPPSSGVEDSILFGAGAPNTSDPQTNNTVKRSAVHTIQFSSTFCGSDSASHGPHADCLQSFSATGYTIAQNIFYKCAEQNVQWSLNGTNTWAGLVVENNFFGDPGPDKTSGFGTIGGGASTDCSGAVLRYNIFYGSPSTSGCTGGNMLDNNNLFLFALNACSSNSTYDHNVFASAATTTCGTNTQHCDTAFVTDPASMSNPAPVLSGSDTCARGHGTAGSAPTNFPTLDLYGHTRPLSTIDAGPSEVN